MYQTATYTDFNGDVLLGMANQTVSCDECEKPVNGISQTDDSLCLCPDCNENFGSLPPTMKQSLEKWLMGNVL